MSANDEILKGAIRHQITLRQYQNSLNRELSFIMERSDKKLKDILRAKEATLLAKNYKSKAWSNFTQSISDMRKETMKELREIAREQFIEIGNIEAAFERNLLLRASPVDITISKIAASTIRDLTINKPIMGRFLREWFGDLERADLGRIMTEVKRGSEIGLTLQDIVKNVIGTRKNGYADGVVAGTRRGIEIMTRTCINDIANAAREEVWRENDDIIECLVWVSTLDGRTTVTCAANDGKGIRINNKPLPEGIEPLPIQAERPPAHIGCRSVLVGYIDGVGLLGRRPTVADERTRDEREKAFRKQAREENRPIQEIRKEWSAEKVGTVPSKTTYDDFLRSQSKEFQNDMLGKSKAELFRSGEKLSSFVDNSGREITLEQLRAERPESFVRAGLEK